MSEQEKRDASSTGKEPRQSLGGPEREATEVEREGMDLLGRSSVRGGAIDGVSDAPARADLSAGDVAGTGGGGPRRNPPENPTAGMGDGGLSMSGGAAGGARGHGGASDDMESLDAGDQPAQFKGTSRFNYDHGSVDEPGGGGWDRDAGPEETR